MRKKSRPFLVQPTNSPFRYIPLTGGRLATVDAEDFDRLSRFTWSLAVISGPPNELLYAVRGGWAKDPDNPLRMKRAPVPLHRDVLQYEGDLLIDHVDTDGLNNRKSNLRLATPSQNQANKRAHKNNTTGCKGVCKIRGKLKWFSTIMVDGVSHYLGQFENAEDAHRAYVEAANEHFGEFARAA